MRFLEHVIRETNKKLYDSNDGLRSALASAAKRRVSSVLTDDIFPHISLIDADSILSSIVQVWKKKFPPWRSYSPQQLSPQNEIPARRMKPLRQSTLIHSRYIRFFYTSVNLRIDFGEFNRHSLKLKCVGALVQLGAGSQQNDLLSCGHLGW